MDVGLDRARRFISNVGIAAFLLRFDFNIDTRYIPHLLAAIPI